jgi:hypothetical protein
MFSRAVAIALALGIGVVAQAEAVPVVSINPASQTVMTGDAVSADIVVSGLTELIGGFSAALTFNDSILIGTSYTNDPDGNFSGLIFDFSFGFSGAGGDESPLDLFMTGNPAIGQPDSFVLARVNFLAGTPGLSALALSGVVLSNEDGTQDITPGIQNGSVCVTDQTGNDDVCRRVPEPGLLALFGAGISALAVRRRTAAKTSA